MVPKKLCSNKGKIALKLEDCFNRSNVRILNVSADYLLLGKEKEGTVDDDIITAVKELPEDYKPLALDAVNNLKKTIAKVTKVAYKNTLNEKQ